MSLKSELHPTILIFDHPEDYEKEADFQKEVVRHADFYPGIKESRNQTLKQRIGNHYVQLYEYHKHDGNSYQSQVTGRAMLSNEVKNIAVIDIDINKEYDDEKKEEIRNKVLECLGEEANELIIVKTGSGGLHIYCNLDNFPVNTNREIKCYSCEDYDIDILSSVDEKRSLVVLPGSKVKKNHVSPISEYTFIKGGYNSVVKHNVGQVIKLLDITIHPKPQKEDMDTVIQTKTHTDLPKEFQWKIVEGFEGLTIHNDGASKIEEEINEFTLFQALNSLSEDLVSYAYGFIKDHCEFTNNAKVRFYFNKKRYANISSNPFILIKMLRIHAPEYYKTVIQPLLNNKPAQEPELPQPPVQKMEEVFELHPIDLNDEFCLNDIRAKAERGEYRTRSEVATDLTKIIRNIDGKLLYVMKVYDSICGKYTFGHCSSEAISKMLGQIRFNNVNDNNKLATAYDALLLHQSKMTVKGTMFNSPADNVLSYFHDYKYQVLPSYSDDIITPFMLLIHQVICDDDDTITNYVLNWISYIIQNPGKKTGTAIILKGLQGAGKGTFGEVISELLSGYSAKNITDISQIAGKFNAILENKMFVFLNEVKNCGEDRLSNFDALKSLITDYDLTINEKNVPMRQSENVANFIFATNNSFPVKVEVSDRRYLVLTVSGRYKGQYEFFKPMKEALKKAMEGEHPEIFDHLLTYFMTRDITTFNPYVIPMTEAKQNLIEASQSAFQEWVNLHYDELAKGIQRDAAQKLRPDGMKPKNFKLAIRDVCVEKQCTEGGKHVWKYFLKDEQKPLYHQTYDDDDYGEFVQDEEPPNVEVD